MSVLVAYASKHGATGEIAERIAWTLAADGRPAVARTVEDVTDVTGYDAFVIGGAAYYGHWFKPVTRFVRRYAVDLSDRPTWLFSSGPLGTETVDDQGRDQREVAVPQELGELRELIGARGATVFFGALDPGVLTVPERALRRLPAGARLLPEGDFRDWDDVDTWAHGIARQLRGPAAPPHA